MKHWKRDKKRMKREQKYIVRFLRMHHTRVTKPVKWDAIHVIKKTAWIKSINDIKSVALLYNPIGEPPADINEIYQRLGLDPMSDNPVGDLINSHQNSYSNLWAEWSEYMRNATAKDACHALDRMSMDELVKGRALLEELEEPTRLQYSMGAKDEQP